MITVQDKLWANTTTDVKQNVTRLWTQGVKTAACINFTRCFLRSELFYWEGRWWWPLPQA